MSTGEGNNFFFFNWNNFSSHVVSLPWFHHSKGMAVKNRTHSRKLELCTSYRCITWVVELVWFHLACITTTIILTNYISTGILWYTTCRLTTFCLLWAFFARGFVSLLFHWSINSVRDILSRGKRSCLRRDSNLWHTAYHADTLTNWGTEAAQLGWPNNKRLSRGNDISPSLINKVVLKMCTKRALRIMHCTHGTITLPPPMKRYLWLLLHGLD